MDSESNSLSLFEGLSVDEKGDIHPSEVVQGTLSQGLKSLLSLPSLSLTDEEQGKIDLYHEAQSVLGPAGSSIQVCPADDHCPFSSTCPLLKMKKAPKEELCPFEAHYVTGRYEAWVNEFVHELNANPVALGATYQAAISSLVWLDLQEMRCTSELAKGENSKLSELSVKDIDQFGAPVAWEKVIHTNAQRLNEIGNERRQLLKAFELTPEQKTKKNRMSRPGAGNDLSTSQSSKMDLVRASRKSLRVIDATPTSE